MASLKVYQIGVRDLGRYGFEKMLEIDQHLEEADVELSGVCDRDFEAVEAAEKFADAHGIEIETFRSVDELYEAAEKEDGKVLIYDAGPEDTRAEHIFRSMRNDFFHLAEKPPSMDRKQHMREKRLALESEVFWKADFIERESPVVKKTVEILEDETVDSIRVFRESSVGVQKMLQPAELSSVKGGDILDKMVNEVYVLDFLAVAGKDQELELETAEPDYLMPKKAGSEKMMTVHGGVIDEISSEVATGQTSARFDASGTTVELNSSWLGLSTGAASALAEIESKTGHVASTEGYTEADGKAFVDQEARFFIVEGSRNLAGDMLHGKLFDLDTGEEIDTPELFHDQLYRVIEKAVLQAMEKREAKNIQEEIDVFMNALFDARETAIDNAGDFFDELEKSNRKVINMIVESIRMDEEEVEA